MFGQNGDTVKIQLEYNGNTIRIQLEYDSIAIRIQIKYNSNTIEIRVASYFFQFDANHTFLIYIQPSFLLF